MNPYLEPQGFLGTGASLLADVTLIAYLLLIIPAMIVGFIYARRKKHRPQHKWVMISITIVNWILIIFLMFAAYRFDVAPNIGAQPNNTRYLLPTLHGLLGIPAQLLATFIILRMFLEDSQVARAKRRGEKDTSRYWFRRAKPVMQLTLALWLVTAALGVLSYLIRYDVIPASALSAEVIAPISTEELLAPVETAEALAPLETPEVIPTTEEADPSATPTGEVTLEGMPLAPVATEELLAPVETEEIASTTPTRRASATRSPTATRTPRAPAATEEIEPVETPELDS